MTNPLTDITVAQLKRAVTIKEQIDRLERELSALLGARKETSAGDVQVGQRRRRRMSPAARAKIAAAARARWAKVKAGKGK